MRFNSVKSSDYSSGARAVNRSSDAAFDASRKSSFDFTGVSNAAIAARSTERRAAMKAEALKDQTEIKADTLVEGTKLKRDTDKAVADIKRPAKRMAGVVAGLGSIATAAVLNKENKEAKAERLKFRTDQAAITTKQQEQFNASQKATNKMIEQLQSTLKPTDTSTATTSDNTSSSASSSSSTSTASPASSSTTYTPATGTGGMTSQFKKIYDLAVTDGRSKFPEIVAAQAMHETGHLNPDISSVYNSSGGTNPFGQTGDRGYGTMTRQGDSSGWSSFPDLQTAVSDHITLWHDTGNHSENYNAHGSASDGLSKVIPAYSPNSDPANQTAGFTESGYSASVKKILRDNGFDVK